MAANKPPLPEVVAKALEEAERPERELHQELGDAENRLRAKGLVEAAGILASVRMDALGLGGVSRKMGDVAKGMGSLASRQWELFNQEIEESKDVMHLLRRRLSGDIKSFSKHEETLIREQIADIFRAVPATAMALAPIPGIAILTPFVLKRLNLLPSAWREANMISRLELTAKTLREKGETEEAERVEEMARDLRDLHHEREDRTKTLKNHPDIRLLYDFNMDGHIDDEEWAMIKADRDRIRELIAEDPESERWYFTSTGEVVGPWSIQALLKTRLPEHSLVTSGELEERWVPITLVYEAAEGLLEAP